MVVACLPAGRLWSLRASASPHHAQSESYLSRCPASVASISRECGITSITACSADPERIDTPSEVPSQSGGVPRDSYARMPGGAASIGKTRGRVIIRFQLEVTIDESLFTPLAGFRSCEEPRAGDPADPRL